MDTSPSQSGFLAFVRNVMGISSAYVPDNSTSLIDAYTVALEWVNTTLDAASPTIYTMAVYNLGGDTLINWCPDQAGQTYFQDLRKSFHCTSFVPGVVSSTSDEGTSSSLTVPKAFEMLTFSDLQNIKTPYGRQYLAIAQQMGTLWGMS